MYPGAKLKKAFGVFLLVVGITELQLTSVSRGLEATTAKILFAVLALEAVLKLLQFVNSREFVSNSISKELIHVAAE